MDEQQSSPDQLYSGQEESSVEYARFVPPKKQKGKSKRVVVLVIILLLIAGGALYWFVLKSKPATKPKATTNSTAQSTPAANVPTKEDNSVNFNLNFNYPETWTVTDSGNGQLTVVSPATPLTSATGQSFTGQIILTIHQMGQGLDAFKTGNGTAVLDSAKVSYSNPTPSQRAQTYLTYVQYPATTASGALDAIYITGDYGYQKGQAVPQVDLAKVDPQVGVTFAKCTTSACTTVTPTNVAATSWAANTSKATETMLKSFSFE